MRLLRLHKSRENFSRPSLPREKCDRQMTIEKINKLFVNYIQLSPLVGVSRAKEKLPGLFRGDIRQMCYFFWGE